MDIRDSFRFIFADKEDVYFTSHLLKLDFKRYLFLELREEGYRHVLFMEPNTIGKTTINCMKEETEKLLNEKAVDQKEGIIWTLEVPIPRERVEDEPFTWSMANGNVKKLLEKLLEDDGKKVQEFAFVIDVNSLEALFHDEKDEQDFDKICNMIRQGKGSAFVITASDFHKEMVPFILKRIFFNNIYSDSSEEAAELYILLKKAHIRAEHWYSSYDSQVKRMVLRLLLDTLVDTDASIIDIVNGKKLKDILDILEKQVLDGLKGSKDTVAVSRREVYDRMVSR